MFTTKADFSGIFESGKQIYVSDVVHRAVLDVNEDGSRASATTGKIIFLIHKNYKSTLTSFRDRTPYFSFNDKINCYAINSIIKLLYLRLENGTCKRTSNIRCFSS